MYTRHARKQGLGLELLDTQGSPPRFVALKVTGDVGYLRGEGGVHKVQHKTKSRRRDRIHTSVVTVAVLEPSPEARKQLDLTKVHVDTFRGSGAGGQHRNVTDSAVRAVHEPTGETVTITSGRSQAINKDAALELLAARLHARELKQSSRSRNQSRRKQAGRADRAGAGRIYDRVRDMVRTRDGRKVHGVDQVLDGDLSKIRVS